MRAILCTVLWAAVIFVVCGALTGCAPDRTDWAGISQAMKGRRP